MKQSWSRCALTSGNRLASVEGLENRTLFAGGIKPVLPAPAIAPGTFEGIGSGPTYIRESFGFSQGTRYKQNGSITAVNIHSNVNGIRAEYPNNKTETWIAPPEVKGGQEWDFSVTGPSDPYEAYTPLQYDAVGDYYSDGTLSINGADPLGAGVDLRPNALLPFAAPTTSTYTVSADTVAFYAKTAIGFSSSAAVNKNFETSGQAWLEVDTTGNFPAGGSTFADTFVFHTNGLSGASVSGTFELDPTSFNRLAVSYDPVAKLAEASINGVTVASMPLTLSGAVKYVGVEGSWYATVDNFTVRTGTVETASVTPPLARALFSAASITADVLGSSTGSGVI